MTKAEAQRVLRDAGYTVYDSTGSCGDSRHGSRIYYRRPDGVTNQFGIYQCATVSRVGRAWLPWVPPHVSDEEWSRNK